MIAKPKKSDISSIADLHILSLPNELLSKLGKEFLIEVYSEALHNDDSFFIVNKTGRKIHGFVFLSVHSEIFYKRLIARRFLKMTRIVLKKLVNDFSLLRKLVATAKHLLFSESESIPEILVFSVDPAMQRNGIGSSLLKVLEDKLAHADFSVYNVKTTSSNEKSNSFYKKSGFKVINRFNIQQQRWVEYRKKF